MFCRRIQIAFVLAVLLVGPHCAQKCAADVGISIDALMKKQIKPEGPGAVVLVARNSIPIYRKAFGLADMELRVTMVPDDVFELGSMTKQFTAVGILMLMEQGKLSLEDDLVKFLPDYPTAGNRITIRNLLNHTSGIKDYTNMPEWLPLLRKDMSPSELIDIFKNQPADFKPGERWAYDNSGYILLGAIIEKVSGETYPDFIQKHIFEPLGMKNSYYGDNQKIIPGRVEGYSSRPEGFSKAAYLSMTQPYAAGSLMSNVDDLLLWDEALYTEKLVKQSSLKKAWTPSVLSNGIDTGYGFGWAIAEYASHRVIAHGGSINGFATDAIRLPDEHVYIVVLSNNESYSSEDAAIKIMGLILNKPIENPIPIHVAAESLEPFVGVYRIDENTERIVTREGDKLYSQRTGGERNELIPYAPAEFFLSGELTRFRFARNTAEKVIAMERLEVINYGPHEIAQRTDKPIPKEREAVAIDPQIFDAYAGQYEVAPGTILSITREPSGHFFAELTGQQKFEIFAQSETKFFLKAVDAQLEFQKDPAGKVTEVILYQAGQAIHCKRK